MVKLERTQAGRVTLTATDRDHFATMRLEGRQEDEPETLLVPYDELQKAAKMCGKDEQILIERDGSDHVIIKYSIGNQYAAHQVETSPVEEFPALPEIYGQLFPVPASLRESIQHAFECASTDETRFVLNGAYLDVGDEQCHQVVATDGRHLFSGNSFTLPLKQSVIIPTHRFLQWKEFCRDGEWQLEIAPGSGADAPQRIRFSSRKWQFVTSEINGNFPNWRQVIPSSSEAKTGFEIDRGSVEQVIHTIQRMPCHDSVNFVIGLEVNGEKVQLLGKSGVPEFWTRVDVPTVKITGKPMLIFLNRNLLTKALRFGLTRIDLIDPMSPLRFSSGGRQMIVMPTRADAVPAAPPVVITNGSSPEESGAGATSSVAIHSGTDPQPTTATTTTNERSPMLNNSRSSSNHPRSSSDLEVSTSPAPPSSASRIDEALELVDSLKESLQEGLTGLKDLSSKLKVIQREQRSSEREFQAIRSTLRTLQSVKL